MDAGELDVANRDLKAALKVWKLTMCAGVVFGTKNLLCFLLYTVS
jgi:hypothetical protein